MAGADDALAAAEGRLAALLAVVVPGPEYLSGLAVALGELDQCHDRVGRTGGADAAWDAALAAMPRAGMRLELTVLRALARPGAAEAAADLRRATALIDGPGTPLKPRARLRAAARTCRARHPSDFDHGWRADDDGLPEWLTLDADHLDVVTRWVMTETLADAARFAAGHSDELLAAATEAALVEVALATGDERATDHEREVLAAARVVGFADAYAPMLQARALADFLDASLEQQARTVEDDGVALRTAAGAREDLVDPRQASHRSGMALLALADGGLLDRAVSVLGRADEVVSLCEELVIAGNARGLAAFTEVIDRAATDWPGRALSLFYGAMSSTLAGNLAMGHEAMEAAEKLSAGTVADLASSLPRLVAAQPALVALVRPAADSSETVTGD
ncbi:MAG: hypothetical protein ACT4PW_02995 [Acidimicrobiia bacterium]